MANVTIYGDANFQGASQVLSKGRYDGVLQPFTIGNDKLSSLKVPQGLVARLYEHAPFQGYFIDIKEDTPAINLFWNDRISSIVIYEATETPPVTKEITIFEDANYVGKSQILQKGRYDVAQILIGNNALSSALVPYGMVLRLYENTKFQGAFIEIREDTPAISLDWNDRASSIIVDEAPVGLWKTSNTNAGVIGESTEFNGVRGISHASSHGAVVGINDNFGPGVQGRSAGSGVWGESTTWNGVYGETESTTGGTGVWGEHKGNGTGVLGLSKSGVGVHGKGGRLAGYFEGDIEVTGDIRLINADCAEDFDICETEQIEPGTVMVLGADGKLEQSRTAYDKRVAGVVSGAGSYKPELILDKQASSQHRMPIALMGKVYCKVDASGGAIAIGDLLTTSSTPGHAMKADDPLKAFGAVIGKALRPLQEGQGLIPILIALQ